MRKQYKKEEDALLSSFIFAENVSSVKEIQILYLHFMLDEMYVICVEVGCSRNVCAVFMFLNTQAEHPSWRDVQRVRSVSIGYSLVA
jgi:hypothetical protein